MNWKPEYTLALTPIAGTLLVSFVLAAATDSATTAQWGAIVTFLVLTPYCIARLLNRER